MADFLKLLSCMKNNKKKHLKPEQNKTSKQQQNNEDIALEVLSFYYYNIYTNVLACIIICIYWNVQRCWNVLNTPYNRFHVGR